MPERKPQRPLFLLGVAWLCAALGCGDGLFRTPAEDVVRAQFDPAESVLPTPTDLARDADLNQLDLPVDGDLSQAEQEFRRYLNRLDGYPLQSTLRIPFDGPIAPWTADGSVLLLDSSDESRVPIETHFDEDSWVLEAFPQGSSAEEGLQPGRTYVMGVRGYRGGMRGRDDERVVADAAFYFLRAQVDLRAHVEAMPGADHAEKEEAADALEELRLELRPFQEMLVRRGITADELAVLSSFTTTRLPSIWYDPDRGLLPLPNGLLIDPETERVDLPEDEEDSQKKRDIKASLADYDGFSTTAPIVFEASERVEAASVADPQHLRLFRLGGLGDVEEIIDVERAVLDDGKTFYLRPRLPLSPSSHFVAVATRGIRSANGEPLEAQPLSALLSSSATLLRDGASEVSTLTAEDAERLERWRVLAQPVIQRLNGSGVTSSQIAALVPFRTLSVGTELLAERERIYSERMANVSDLVIRTPSERGISLIMPSVETIVTGSFVTRDRLDPRTHQFFEDEATLRTPVPFVLTLPKNVSRSDKVPVVLFGHGLFTSRELVYMIAETLSSRGFATFSIDFPYHGLRTKCHRDEECQGDATCDPLGECQRPDGTRGELATLSSPWPDGPSWPSATGAYFIDPDHIVGSRDHFVQSVCDLFQAVRVVRENDWNALVGWSLDPEDVVYLGMSLGAIVGSVFAGVEPHVTTFVLNAGGGDLYRMLVDSDAFESMYAKVLRDEGISPGTDEEFRFEAGLRWLLDAIDPVNVAHHATQEPLEILDPTTGVVTTAPRKRLMLQMAEGDSVVPNSSTRALSERTGVTLRTYRPLISDHAFLFDPTSLEGARARNDALDFFDGR